MAQAKSSEGKKYDHTLRDFGGVNTQAARQAIGDNEFAWLENIQPVGYGNFMSIPAPVDTGIMLAATCYWMRSANLANVDYMMCFCTNGSAYQVNLTSYAVTTIGAAGTFNGSGTKFDQWANSLIVIVDPTKGVFSWDGTTLVNLSGAFAITASIAATTLTVTITAGVLAIGQSITGAGIAANTIITGFVGGSGGAGTYTVNNTQAVGSEAMTATSSAPATGTAVAVYAGRVWIANGRTVTFSAPGSYTDFTVTDFGGSFTITDSTLHSIITQMIATSGFLYIIGYDSINVVSDVRISTTPATTLFSNLNLVTTTGTAAPSSVVPYFRTIWMAAPYGFYAVTGANAQKGSDNLDGIFQALANTTGISGGVVVINKIVCLCFLLSYNDPVNGNRPLFAIFFNKKWFFASQGSDLQFAATASLVGTQVMYATDGLHLYRLFSDTTTNISQTIITKLWDFEDTLLDKQVLKCGAETVMLPSVGQITLTADSELASSPSVNAFGNAVIWQNSSFANIAWTNSIGIVVTWVSQSGYAWFRSDVSNYGKYAGLTLETSAPSLKISALQLQYELRARW